MWGHWYLVLVLTAEGISFWEPRSCSSLASSLRPAIPLLPCAHAEAQVPCLAPPDTARLVQSVGDGPGQATATYIQCFVCVIIISLNLLAISYEDCYSFGHPGPQGKGVNRWGAPPPPPNPTQTIACRSQSLLLCSARRSCAVVSEVFETQGCTWYRTRVVPFMYTSSLTL